MNRRPPVAELSLVLVLTALVAVALALAPGALANERVTPFASEARLTRAERDLALETMAPQERTQLGGLFTDDADGLVLSYARKLIRIAHGADGRQVPHEIVPSRAAPRSSLAIPNQAVAGSAARYDLYISLTVAKTRSTAPYEWRIYTYAEWRGDGGMNATNSSADTMALAWAGGAYVHSNHGSGRYAPNWPCNSSELNEWPSDGAPNTGLAWSFNEFSQGWFGGCPMNWALVDARIRQDSVAGRTDDIVFKYFHTYGGLSYDFSFSKSPGVRVSPTDEQWALTLFGSYTH